MKARFDVCLICFADIQSDARTLNMVKTFRKADKSVCTISVGREQSYSEIDNYARYIIQDYNSTRSSIRWYWFIHTLKKLVPKINSKVFIAMDLYSLIPSRNFAKANNAKLIYDSREIYSALGPLYKNFFKQNVISLIERYLIKYVDEFIVSGQLDAEYLKSAFNTNKEFKVIMNLPPYRDYFKSDLIRKKYSISGNNIILVYQGVLLPGRGLLHSIELLKYIDNATLCIIGEGIYKNALEKKVKDCGVNERVIFTGKVSYEDLHEWTCSANIGLCLIEPITLSYKYALPNKLFEYCMARIPSIATSLPAIENIISQHPFARLVPINFEPQHIVEQIRELIQPDNLQMIFFECDKASHIFSYENQESTILSLLN